MSKEQNFQDSRINPDEVITLSALVKEFFDNAVSAKFAETLLKFYEIDKGDFPLLEQDGLIFAIRATKEKGKYTAKMLFQRNIFWVAPSKTDPEDLPIDDLLKEWRIPPDSCQPEFSKKQPWGVLNKIQPQSRFIFRATCVIDPKTFLSLFPIPSNLRGENYPTINPVMVIEEALKELESLKLENAERWALKDRIKALN